MAWPCGQGVVGSAGVNRGNFGMLGVAVSGGNLSGRTLVNGPIRHGIPRLLQQSTAVILAARHVKQPGRCPRGGAKVPSKKLRHTQQGSAFGRPIWLGRKPDNRVSKPVPMRFVALKYDHLDIQVTGVVHCAKRQRQVIGHARVFAINLTAAGRTKRLGHI